MTRPLATRVYRINPIASCATSSRVRDGWQVGIPTRRSGCFASFLDLGPSRRAYFRAMSRQPKAPDRSKQDARCSGCDRVGAWHAHESQAAKSDIVVAVPAVSREAEVLGQVLHPATIEFAWLQWLFSVMGYDFDRVRTTSVVKCAGPSKPSVDSVSRCRGALAVELAAARAKVLVILENDNPCNLWPLFGSTPPNGGIDLNRLRTVRSDGRSIPVIIVPALSDAISAGYVFHQPDYSPLARALVSVAKAVTIATGKAPIEARPTPALAEDFAKRFMGLVSQRALADVTDQPFLEKVSTRLTAVGLPTGSHRQVLRRLRQQFLAGATGHRVQNFRVPRHPGRNTSVGWTWETIEDRKPGDNLLALHLMGVLAVSSFGLKTTTVLTLDIDRHNNLQRANFDDTVARVRDLFPEALPIRSSSSGGVHLLIFLKTRADYKQLAALARLFLQRQGLGSVTVGHHKYQRVEVPATGVRLPLGPGSWPLLPGMDSSTPMSDMLAALFAHADEYAISPDVLFRQERAAVDALLKTDGIKVTVGARAAAAEKLLREAEDANEQPITNDQIAEGLRDDRYGHLFREAPIFIQRPYIHGITTYGTRSNITRKIAVWLARMECSERKAIRVLRRWIHHRSHASHDIETRPDWVLEQLPAVVSTAFRFAGAKGYVPGKMTERDVSKLLKILLNKEIPNPSGRVRLNAARDLSIFATSRSSPRKPPPPPRRRKTADAPAKQGTAAEQFLNLGFGIIKTLRGHGGEHWISHEDMRKRLGGGRYYERYLRRLLDHKAIECIRGASKEARLCRTYRLLWPDYGGKRVSDLKSGLAQVMHTKDIRKVFAGRPGIINQLIKKRAAWKRRKLHSH